MPSEAFFVRAVEAMGAVNATLDLGKTQRTIVQIATTLAEARGASLLLFNPGDRSLQISAAYGLSDTYLSKGPIDPRQSLQETVLRKPVFINDVENDPRVQYPQAARQEGIRAIAGFPVSAGRLLVGSLRVYFPHRIEVTAYEIKALEALAKQAGYALKKNFYYDSMKNACSEIHRMHSVHSFKQSMDMLIESAARGAHAYGCALWHVNRETDVLELVSSYGLSRRYLEKGPLFRHSSLGELQSRAPVVLSKVEGDERVQYPEQAAEEGVRAIVGFPVKWGKDSLGSLRFYFQFEFDPDEDDMLWMGHLAEQVEQALSNKRLIIRMKEGHDRYLDLTEDTEAGYYR
ncbi:MAG: GAF domain-containing protein [Deltaproteobacteria bacterium]|nr:GAF domain-containing protein [Deltaproteobacteria bacterium]